MLRSASALTRHGCYLSLLGPTMLSVPRSAPTGSVPGRRSVVLSARSRTCRGRGRAGAVVVGWHARAFLSLRRELAVFAFPLSVSALCGGGGGMTSDVMNSVAAVPHVTTVNIRDADAAIISSMYRISNEILQHKWLLRQR